MLALFETKFPVWYPYYVNWGIGIAFECFFILASTHFGGKKDAFDIAIFLLQVLRLVTLMALPYVFMLARNRKEVYENVDEERQSLLRNKLAPRPGSLESTEEGNGYGTTENDSDSQESEVGEEDSYLKMQRENKEMMEKRLRNDGNWWTYAKGFSVSN
jgi:hypothetical protein